MKALLIFAAIVALAGAAQNTISVGDGDITLRVPEFAHVKFAHGPQKTIRGQVFVRSRGGEIFKIGGSTVRIYPSRIAAEYEQWINSKGKRRVASFKRRETNLINADQSYRAQTEKLKAEAAATDNWSYLPKAPIELTTDADGRFYGVIDSSEAYAVIVLANRLVGQDREWYLWVVHEKDAKNGEVILSHQNVKEP